MQRFIFGVLLWLGLATLGFANQPHTKRGIFVVPGAFVAPEAYDPLVQKIAAGLGESVDIAYARYFGSFPTPSGTNRQLAQFYESIRAQGFEPNITVIAHSQGGLALRGLPEELYARAVLMSSYVQSDWFATSAFPWSRPVLSISGTLDRLTPPERVAFDHYRFQSNGNFKVILLDGVNHSQFANGQIRNIDVPSPLPMEDAQGLISRFIVGFVEQRLPQLKSDSDLLFSEKLLKGYRRSFDQDQKACVRAQLAHLGWNEESPLRIKHVRYTNKRAYGKFILDKSYINTNGDQPEIGIFQFDEMRVAPLDITPLRAVSPEVIACKLRSREAVADRLGGTFEGRSCAQENLEILRDAYNDLPPSTKVRLREKGVDLGSTLATHEVDEEKEVLSGPGFTITDTFRQRGDQWALGSFFSSNLESTSLSVQTYSVKTPVGQPDNLFLGAYYCKLLAPSRAFQLLTHLGA